MSVLNQTTSLKPAKSQVQHSKTRTILMGILGVKIGRILALLAAVVLCLPVVLLPISTLVPAWVWIPLGVSDLVLIFLQFHLKPAGRGIALSLEGSSS